VRLDRPRHDRRRLDRLRHDPRRRDPRRHDPGLQAPVCEGLRALARTGLSGVRSSPGARLVSVTQRFPRGSLRPLLIVRSAPNWPALVGSSPPRPELIWRRPVPSSKPTRSVPGRTRSRPGAGRLASAWFVRPQAWPPTAPGNMPMRWRSSARRVG
jgi:hypothetical protein